MPSKNVPDAGLPERSAESVVDVAEVDAPAEAPDIVPVVVRTVRVSVPRAVALISTFLRFADVAVRSVTVVPAGTCRACPNFFSVRAI